MLTVQTGISNIYNISSAPSFGRKDRGRPKTEEQLAEEKYIAARKDLEEAKDNLEEAASEMPRPLKKTIAIFAIGATGILGGMATGWGGSKTIQAIKKILNSDAGVKFTTKMKNGYHAVIDAFKNTRDFVKTEIRKVKADFKQTNFYNKSKTKYDNFFEKTRVGRGLSSVKTKIKENSVYQSVTGGIKNAYKWCKDGMTNIYIKLSNIKGKQVEKAAVNTLGVSGGVASGVTAMKEEQREDD